METLYFPPILVSEYLAWLKNFNANLQPIYQTYDITESEMSELSADERSLAYIVGRQETYASTSSLFITTRNIFWSGDPENPNLELVNYEPQVPEVKADIIPPPGRPNLYARLKSIVLRLRQHPKMNESTAKLLGIQPRPKSSDNPVEYLPVLSVSVLNGQAILDCPVRGFAGYEVWRDRTNNNNLTMNDKSVGRTWTDTTPLPDGVNAEIRQYRVRMLDSNNQPIGQFSNTVAATVSRAI
ncbi:MAG: hypothetical protein IPN76_09440 [Saprospiraceae bacterium]|nr:hypothetical protein [Saprospiraceae bacterium]